VADGKRAQRVADTRSRLIAVSLDLYERQGFEATTIDQIAELAGIHRSTFFRYFDGKEAVLFAPMVASSDWFLDQLAARPPGEPLMRSVVEVCTEGTWPLIDRRHLKKIRAIVATNPLLQAAVGSHVASALRPRLVECLSSRHPEADDLVVDVVAALALMWSDRAISLLIETGGDLPRHFADVIGTTASVLDEVRALSVIT
jgi:AcrR family transcriptional regulator